MTDYKDLLPDFLDGNLSEDEEKAVFYQLSQDDELLAEYKKLKRIFSAIDKSKANFEPNPELTANIFAKLGIREAPEKKKRAFPFFLHKPALKYIAAAAASVLLFLSVNKFDNSEIFNSANKYQAKKHNSDKQLDNKEFSLKAENANTANSDIITTNNKQETEYAKATISQKTTKQSRQVGYSKTGESVSITSVAMPFSYSQDLYEDDDAQSNDNLNNSTEYNEYANDEYQDAKIRPMQYDYVSSDDENQCPPEQDIAMSDYSDEYGNNEYSGNYDYPQDVFRRMPLNLSIDYTSNNSLSQYSNYNMQSYSAPKEKFYLEIKNHIYFSKVKEEVSTNYTNLGISLYYNLIDKISFGLDVRDESFNKYCKQRFMPSIKSYGEGNDHSDESLKTALFSLENVPTTTVSLSAKYDLLTKYREFTPSALVSFGLNSAGTVGRASLSCSFNTLLNITASIGAEYSVLSYEYLGLNTTSSKVGVSVGVSYNF